MEHRWHDAVLEDTDGLEQPRHAGRGFEVAEGRLRRTDRQRPGAAIEDVVQRGQLDRVAQRRAGPVSLDVGDVGRGDGSVGERRSDHRPLRRPTGSGEAVRPAVMVDGAAAEDGDDRVARGLGVREELEDDTAPLAAYVPVGGGVERLAAAIGRQRPTAMERQRRIRRD